MSHDKTCTGQTLALIELKSAGWTALQEKFSLVKTLTNQEQLHCIRLTGELHRLNFV